MNAIATGEHVELHKEDLPPFFTLMNTDDRQGYVRSHQSHTRKFRPDSELELGLLRGMVCALFQYDRFTSLYAEALPRELDQVLREYPTLPSFVLPFYVVNMLNNNELMSKMAPDYDLGDWIDRYGFGDLPKAA